MNSLLLICFITCCGISYGSNILFIPSFLSPSHKLSMLPWADALVEKGHNVLLWQPVLKLDKYVPKLAQHDQFEVGLDLDSSFNIKVMGILSNMSSPDGANRLWGREWNVPGFESVAEVVTSLFCREMLDKNWAKNILPILETKWDLVIIDELFNSCGNVVAYELKRRHNTVVNSYVSTSRLTPHASEYSGVPQPPAYVPTMGMLQILGDTMSFLQRVHSVIILISARFGSLSEFVGLCFMIHILVSVISAMISLHLLGDRVIMPSLHSGVQNPGFVFNNYMLMNDLPNPILPNFVFIGGMQLKDSKNPDQNLHDGIKDMVENSNNRGTIVVTFGHLLPIEHAPEYISRCLLGGLQRLAEEGHVILVQSNGTNLKYPSLNFLPWIPVQPLLAHPKTVAVVNHGGGNSVTELLHSSLPALLVPIGAEQPDATARAVRLGVAKGICKLTITKDSVYDNLKEIITNKRWKKRAEKVTKMIKDTIISPKDSVVFWSEYSIKHGNYVRFRRHPSWTTQGGFWNTLKFHSCDTIGAFTIILMLSLCIVYKFFKTMYIWVRSFTN